MGDLQRRNLNRLLKQAAYLQGNFTLKSGRTATEYLDIRGALARSDVRALLGEQLLKAAGKLCPGTHQVAGVVFGGALLAQAVSTAAEAYWMDWPALSVRVDSRDHGTRSRVEGLRHRQSDAVVLVEDVLTTGGSALVAIEALEAEGLIVKGVLAVAGNERAEQLEVARPGLPIFLLTNLDAVRAAV